MAIVLDLIMVEQNSLVLPNNFHRGNSLALTQEKVGATICLAYAHSFCKNCPKYAYKRYAYKKKHVFYQP